MDLIRQYKIIGWIIAFLILLNAVTLTLLWLRPDAASPVSARGDGNPGPGPLMKRSLDLSGEQEAAYEQLRSEYLEQSKPINERLESLKLRLAAELFASPPDTGKVDSITAAIGEWQTQLERARFNHFSRFLRICSPAQREKLQPILREVFGRKPPRDGQDVRPRAEKQPGRDSLKAVSGPASAPPRRGLNAPPPLPGEGDPPPPGGRDDQPPPGGRDDRRPPPSDEEKVERYARRLALTSDQRMQLADIFKDIRTEEASLKAGEPPGSEEFDRKKAAIRKKEDDRILKILTPAQQKEFSRMMEQRNRNDRR